MVKHYDIQVFGLVQGVWYRASARDAAVQLGLHGFVRNEYDGSVYIEAEGEKEKLDELVAWCRKGPPRAEVERVEVKEGELKSFRDFVVTR